MQRATKSRCIKICAKLLQKMYPAKKTCKESIKIFLEKKIG